MGNRKHVIPMEQHHFYFDPENKPVLHIESGDEVTFFTEDANCSSITEETDIINDWAAMCEEDGGCNPMTGPVYVNGAKKGDYLAIEILKVKAGEERNGGYSAHYPRFGSLHADYILQEPLEARTKILKIDAEGKGIFKTNDGKREIHYDLNPFIGNMAVAPAKERWNTNGHNQEILGNVDCPDIKEGATIVLPCNVDGGLFSLGDVHGAQGDGEITGCAMECRGEVTVRITRLSAEEAKYCKWPQCNTKDTIGAIICANALNLTDQIRFGYAELINRMHDYYGFDKIDAYQLLNLVGRVQIGQVFESCGACIVKIPRKYLE